METIKTVTDAPLAYDGFGTITTTVLGVDKDGNIWRVVRTPEEHLHWQHMRYASGNHIVLADDRLDDIVYLAEHQGVQGLNGAAHPVANARAAVAREDNPRFALEEQLGRTHRGTCANPGPFCGEDHYVAHFTVLAAQGNGIKIIQRAGPVWLFEIFTIDRLYFPEIPAGTTLMVWSTDDESKHLMFEKPFDEVEARFTEARRLWRAEHLQARHVVRATAADAAASLAAAATLAVTAFVQAAHLDEDDDCDLRPPSNIDLAELAREIAAWADNVRIWSGDLPSLADHE